MQNTTRQAIDRIHRLLDDNADNRLTAELLRGLREAVTDELIEALEPKTGPQAPQWVGELAGMRARMVHGSTAVGSGVTEIPRGQ